MTITDLIDRLREESCRMLSVERCKPARVYDCDDKREIADLAILPGNILEFYFALPERENMSNGVTHGHLLAQGMTTDQIDQAKATGLDLSQVLALLQQYGPLFIQALPLITQFLAMLKPAPVPPTPSIPGV